MAKDNNDNKSKKEKKDGPMENEKENETSGSKKVLLISLKDLWWVIGVLVVCLAVGWGISEKVRVNPLQLDIDKQETQVEKLTRQKNKYRKAIEELEILTRQDNECQKIIQELKDRLVEFDNFGRQGTKFWLKKGTAKAIDIMGESILLELLEASQTTDSAIVRVGSDLILNIYISNREKQFKLRDREYKLILLEAEDDRANLKMELLKNPDQQ